MRRWEADTVRHVSGVRLTCLVRRGDYLQTRFGLLGRRVGVPDRVVTVALTERVCGRTDAISRHAEPHLLGVYLVGVDCREPDLPVIVGWAYQ